MPESALKKFQRVQYAFAAHLRDPQKNPAPADLEDRRMQIYRDLFFNNVEDILGNAFPVLRAITDDQTWLALVRDFYARHQCHDPRFYKISEEFLGYLEHTRGEHAGDPPFLKELAHYEWVEMALAVSDLALTPELADPNGDLLESLPLASPLAWTLIYDFPVQRIGPDFMPNAPGAEPTCLIVYRTRQDEVKFMEVNAITARLMQLIGEAAENSDAESNGRRLLQRVAEELQHPQPDAVVAEGARILQGLRERDILLGTRRRDAR